MTDPPQTQPLEALPELTRDQARRIDRIAIERHGMSGLVLMENAGRNCAERLRSRTDGPVAICCGKGNNAGDGFVIARHLANAGCDVTVLMSSPVGELSDDAAANHRLLALCDVATVSEVGQWATQLERAAWIVDAMLGTGASGPPRAPLDAAIEAVNHASKPVFAVDLPSGLDSDTGERPGACVAAALTATFVAPKVGFATKSAADVLGLVETIDIGVPRSIIADAIAGG